MSTIPQAFTLQRYFLKPTLITFYEIQSPETSTLKISPGSHSTVTSNGRQHTSQSVVNRCVAMLVSTGTAKLCPQNGHCTSANSSISEFYAFPLIATTRWKLDLSRA